MWCWHLSLIRSYTRCSLRVSVLYLHHCERNVLLTEVKEVETADFMRSSLLSCSVLERVTINILLLFFPHREPRSWNILVKSYCNGQIVIISGSVGCWKTLFRLHSTDMVSWKSFSKLFTTGKIHCSLLKYEIEFVLLLAFPPFTTTFHHLNVSNYSFILFLFALNELLQKYQQTIRQGVRTNGIQILPRVIVKLAPLLAPPI